MNAETYPPAVTTAEQVAIPVQREKRDAGGLIAAFLWQLFVIAVGIFVGSIVAVIAGLYLGWLDISC